MLPVLDLQGLSSLEFMPGSHNFYGVPAGLEMSGASGTIWPSTPAGIKLGVVSNPFATLVLGNAANKSATFSPSALTDNRTFTLPDKSGTLATIADIPSGTRIFPWSMNDSGLDTVNTQFIGIGLFSAAAGDADLPMPLAGSFSSCTVRVGTSLTGSMTRTYTLQKNGADCGTPGAVSMVLNAGNSSLGAVISDMTNSCSFVAGDRLSWKSVPTNAASADYPAFTCAY